MGCLNASRQLSFNDKIFFNKNKEETSLYKLYKISNKDKVIEHFLAQDLSINNPGDNIINEI
jgi:hypothetical protein